MYLETLAALIGEVFLVPVLADGTFQEGLDSGLTSDAFLGVLPSVLRGHTRIKVNLVTSNS